jgi:hypothetical protein
MKNIVIQLLFSLSIILSFISIAHGQTAPRLKEFNEMTRSEKQHYVRQEKKEERIERRKMRGQNRYVRRQKKLKCYFPNQEKP